MKNKLPFAALTFAFTIAGACIGKATTGPAELFVIVTVVAAVGYRHEEDVTQHYKKVRKSNADLFITI